MDSYRKAWKSIVQPPRCIYDENKELPINLTLQNEQIQRTNIIVPSCDPDEELNLYFYHSVERQVKHILIYVHSFSGSALEGVFLLKEFLPQYSVVLFDQRGCGNNKSEFVTLGLRESIDLNLLVKNLQEKFGNVNIYFWGRQMGAVAVLHLIHQLEASIFYYNYRLNFAESSRNIVKTKRMSNFMKYKHDKEHLKSLLKKHMKYTVYPLKKLNEKQYQNLATRYQMIQRVVYDSPFPSSHSIIKQIMIKHSKINKLMAQMALMPVTHSVKSVLGFDVLGQNKPYLKSQLMQIPGLFFVGEKDDIIDFVKFKMMFDNYCSPEKKMRLMLDQGHGNDRPQVEIIVGKNFLFHGYQEEYEKSEKQILQEEKDQKRTDKNLIDIKQDFELNQDSQLSEQKEIKRSYNDLITLDQSQSSITLSSLSEQDKQDEKEFIEDFEKEIIQQKIEIPSENLNKFKSQIYEFKDQLIFNNKILLLKIFNIINESNLLWNNVFVVFFKDQIYFITSTRIYQCLCNF